MSEMNLHRIASKFYNQPLLLQPSAAETISAFLLQRIAAGRGAGGGENDAASSFEAFRPRERSDGAVEIHQARASRFYGEWATDQNGRPTPYRRTADGTAIITLVGEFVNRGAYIGASSGLISYEGFKHQMHSALQDARTHTILIDIESPGGEAVGCFEAAAVVRECAKKKNVVAVVNGLAASAAYAIASGARKIVIMPTGIAGSIGVVMQHLDFSEYLKNEGVKPTLIFAGAHKVDGNPYEPLPENVRADFQQKCEDFYSQFVETVAAGRRNMSAKSIRATEAQVFKGQEAVDVGLADAVGTLEQVLAELSGGQSRLNPESEPKGPLMSNQNGTAAAANADTPKAITTVADLEAAHPQLVASVREQAATAERTRITDIQSLAMPGREKLIADCVADGKLTKADAALRIVGAENETRKGALASVKGVEDEAKDVSTSLNTTGNAADTQVPQNAEGWKAEWENSQALKDEFPTADLYVGYKSGVASGKVRRLSTVSDRKAS